MKFLKNNLPNNNHVSRGSIGLGDTHEGVPIGDPIFANSTNSMDSFLQAFQELNLLDNGISYVKTVDKTVVVSPVQLGSIGGVVHVDTACDHVLAPLENIPGAVTDCALRIPESGSVSDPHNDFSVRDVNFRVTDPIFGPLSDVQRDDKTGVDAARVSALVGDVSGDIFSPSPETRSISPPVISAVSMGDGQRGSNLDLSLIHI